jgi:hypothetical protein
VTERNRPDRAVVLLIATEEAAAIGADPAAVLAMAIDRLSKRARRAAMLRILAETGCSRSGLAHVWGCDRQVVCRLINPRRPERKAKPERAVNGNDHRQRTAPEQRNADLAAWNALGRRSEAA